MVVNVKYKTKYENNVDDLSIRQVSGYAWLRKVYAILGIPEVNLIDRLIIYHDQENGFEELPEDLKRSAIKNYVGVYRIEVSLPAILYSPSR